MISAPCSWLMYRRPSGPHTQVAADRARRQPARRLGLVRASVDAVARRWPSRRAVGHRSCRFGERGLARGRDQRTVSPRGGSRSRSLPVAVGVTAQLSWRERAQSGIALPYMATYRSASVLLSSDGTRTPGTAALFAEPARKGGTPPWAGDFRPANSAGNGPKNAVGKTFTLELPDGSTGKVVVQSLKSGKGGVVLALMGQDAPPF